MPVARRAGCVAAVIAMALLRPVDTAAAGDAWSLTTPMPTPRWFHAAGVGSDQGVYAYGGYVRTPTKRRAYGVGEHAMVEFEPATGQWTLKPPPPEFLQRAERRATGPPGNAAPVYEEFEGARPLSHELYAGDQAPLGLIHWFSIAGAGAVFFDPATNAWHQKPSPGLVAIKRGWTMEDFRKGVPKDRLEGTWPGYSRIFASAATSADGKVYVIGGTGRRSGDEHVRDEIELLAAVDVYDSVANRWYAIPPMREARQLHAAAVARDGRLYVFGGVASLGLLKRDPDESEASWERRNELDIKAADSSLASVEIYDPKTESWSKGAPTPTPRQAMGAALGADGRIYVVGGTKSYSDPDPLDTVEIYDPASDTWEKGPPLLYPRRGHAVVATPDGKIYAIGGWVWSRRLRLPLSDTRRFEEDGKDLRATVEVLDTKAGD